MNGIGRGGAPPEVQEAQISRLAEFAKGDNRLRQWETQEFGRLAR
jgi:transposase